MQPAAHGLPMRSFRPVPGFSALPDRRASATKGEYRRAFVSRVADKARGELSKHSSIRASIEGALEPLIGMPWWKAHRAADLQVFGFGARRPITNRRGKQVLVGEYSLHVQCGWRISGAFGIIVARRDLYYPAGLDPYRDRGNFRYDGPVPNRRDEQIAALLEARQDRHLMVTSAEANDLGGFCLRFCDGFLLEVFPDDSLDEEHWRLLEPDVDTPHFVVTGRGCEAG